MKIDKDNWKSLDINVDSLWIMGPRAKGGKHTNMYHGNFAPQIPNQMIQRYTDEGDVVLDMFLEHSRIYIFGKEKEAKVYIASADFMTRNTIKRVEVAAPIYDEAIKDRILEDFSVYLADDVKARQQIDGTYVRKSKEGKINAQEYFMERAYKNASENG